jgi:DNA-binding transcriptional MerR regulator
VFGRIYVIKAAFEAGFTIGETRLFLSGFSRDTPPATRWHVLASRKLDEVTALIARAQRMKALLETSFHCGCQRLEDCERLIRAVRRKHSAPSTPAKRALTRQPPAGGPARRLP